MHADTPTPPAPRPARRPDPWFVIVTIVHFVLFPLLIAASYSLSMRNFDSGGPPPPAEPLARWAVKVLSFPLVLPFFLSQAPLRGPAQWVLLLANSVCWGSGVSYAVRRVRR